MTIPRRLLAIPLLLAASAASALGDVRDKAGLFSPEAIEKANAELSRVERETKIPVTIETIPSLRGLTIDDAIGKVGQSEGVRGLLVLISKAEGKIQADSSREYHHYFSRPQYQSIYEAFEPGFRKREFDTGLAQGVAHIVTVLPAIVKSAPAQPAPAAARQPARAQAPAPAPAPARAPVQARSGLPVLIGIVLLVLGVLIVFRLLRALFGAGRGGYGPGYGPGQMRGGPGYGPGYGGPGYGGGGGGGGGFMSSLFGGLGGAMAGNWLYDQFGRRHSPDQAGYVPGSEPTAPADAGPDWQGAGDGGGDWGGGDAGGGGGGGDWGGGGGGGGGGDWGGGGGGGGGDWGGGGGGGGGDWGGGGGDGGGSW